MNLSLINLIYFCIIPTILFYFFCSFSSIKFKWYWSIIYTLLSFILLKFEATKSISALIFLFLEIFLLSVCGVLFIKCTLRKSLIISSLVISIYSISTGITQTLEYLIVANLNPNNAIVLNYIDISKNLITIILLILTFLFILKTFYISIKELYKSALLLLVIPILFISLVEKTVVSFIYGDTVIWDTNYGLVFPVVNSLELLFLQIFSYIGLFSSLIVYKKLIKSIQNEQTIKLLEQQAQGQQIYVLESQTRYKQTSSFRHDIKNHLIILRKLLLKGKLEDTYKYLSNLDQISDSLSFPSHTENTFVDALLESKLSIATQKGIKIKCTVKIPKISYIKDIDWCIILSNAVDNAITACNLISDSKKYISISGKLKGNLYLLHIKNTCLKESKFPKYGIGLSNINAVIEKYNGTMDIEINNEVFYLNILLVISQQ